MKTCRNCKIEKELDEFNKHRATKDGRHVYCKPCKSKLYLEWKIGKEEKLKQYWSNYAKTDKAINSRRLDWELNREVKNKKQRQYHQERRKTDQVFRISKNVRSRLNQFIKRRGFKKSKYTKDILGCTWIFFKQYIESKWEPWMSWDNYGKYNGKFNYGWDIDHIIILSSADSIEKVYELNHYTNLQPLCSKINRDVKWSNNNY